MSRTIKEKDYTPAAVCRSDDNGERVISYYPNGTIKQIIEINNEKEKVCFDKDGNVLWSSQEANYTEEVTCSPDDEIIKSKRGVTYIKGNGIFETTEITSDENGNDVSKTVFRINANEHYMYTKEYEGGELIKETEKYYSDDDSFLKKEVITDHIENSEKVIDYEYSLDGKLYKTFMDIDECLNIVTEYDDKGRVVKTTMNQTGLKDIGSLIEIKVNEYSEESGNIVRSITQLPREDSVCITEYNCDENGYIISERNHTSYDENDAIIPFEPKGKKKIKIDASEKAAN